MQTKMDQITENQKENNDYPSNRDLCERCRILFSFHIQFHFASESIKFQTRDVRMLECLETRFFCFHVM